MSKGSGMLTTFSWRTFDLASRLPDNWQQQLIDAAASADFREYPRTPVLTRESADVRSISRGRLHASGVRRRLPWLYESYRGYFLELAGDATTEPVMAALDDRYGIVLNVQRGTTMRFECHVDSNPLTGLLFCTDYHAGAGGELVFGHDPAAVDTDAVERACSVIRPQAGHLIFFDGRRHAHYARPLTSESQLRIVAVMNFYTMSCPESTRPPELNRHLFQQALAWRHSVAHGGERQGGDGQVPGNAGHQAGWVARRDSGPAADRERESVLRAGGQRTGGDLRVPAHRLRRERDAHPFHCHRLPRR